MPAHRIVAAYTKRLSAMTVLAAALICASVAGARSGAPAPGDVLRVAQADTGRTLAGPEPGAPIIGATDVLSPPESVSRIYPIGVTAPRPSGIAEDAALDRAAQVKPAAADAYREQEVAAQTTRGSLRASPPLPPETVRHPIVHDTATLASATKIYPLDGVTGLNAPYADRLQVYIASHGDSLSCTSQSETGDYACMLPDGTDIAKVALANGLARAGPEASDAYRAEQLDAVHNRRGVWLDAPDDVVTEALTPPLRTEYVFAAGDDGADGISYAGGMPTAVIGGAPVFLVFGAGAGWGYYDRDRQWHTAPGRYRAHLEHFHPDGRGLPGWRGWPGFGYGGQGMRAPPPGNGPGRGSVWFGPPLRPGMAGMMDRPGAPPAGPPNMSGWAAPRSPGMAIAAPRFAAPLGGTGTSAPRFAAPPGGTVTNVPRFAVPPGRTVANQRVAPPGGLYPAAAAQPIRAAAPPPQGNAGAGRRQ